MALENFELEPDLYWLCSGYWWEMALRDLLHLEVITYEEWDRIRRGSHFDIVDPVFNVLWEAKIANNKKSWKISTRSFDLQDAEIDFPDGEAYFALASYLANDHRNGPCLFKKQAGNCFRSLAAWLGTRTRFTVIDRALLFQRRWSPGGVMYYDADPGAKPKEGIKLGRRDLERVMKNPKDTFAQMGIPLEDLPRWVTSEPRSRFSVETEFAGAPMRLQLDVITSPDFEARLIKRLNGAVKRKEVL